MGVSAVCMGFLDMLGFKEACSNASADKARPGRQKAKFPSSTFLYRLLVEGVVQIKGVSSHL